MYSTVLVGHDNEEKRPEGLVEVILARLDSPRLRFRLQHAAPRIISQIPRRPRQILDT